MKPKNPYLKTTGFTLIELLVVVAIIGTLSTLTIIAINNARMKARDAKRVSDIKQIQTALELYYNDENLYPETITTGQPLISTISGKYYLAAIPANPEPANDGDCALGSAYTYIQENSGASYSLRYCLGGSTGGLECAPGDPCIKTATPTISH